MRKLIVLLSLLGLLTGAEAAQSLVTGYFRDLQSLETDFVQSVFDADSQLIESSSGHMLMQKPGRFRWDYRQPYEQLIVADGDRIWHYDSDLEQVTVRRLDRALSATPLALLSGAAPLEDAFTIEDGRKDQGLQWYVLRPRDTQSDFRVLRIAFDANRDLKAIELEDAFKQRTQLNFQALRRDVAIDPALLRFVPPPGVDVVGDLP